MSGAPVAGESSRLILALGLLYAASAWWFALASDPIWDDWVILAHSDRSLLAIATDAGRTDHALLTLPFKWSGDPRSWSLASFLLIGLAHFCLFRLVSSLPGWTETEAFLATALGLAAPLFQARFAFSVLPYAFTAFVFSAALLVTARYAERGGTGRRVLASLLLLLAFSTQSFLTLAFLPPAILAARRFADAPGSFAERSRQAVRAVLRHPEFLILPPAYFVARKLVFPQAGLYSDYNRFRMGPVEASIETVRVLIRQIQGLGILVPDRIGLAEGAVYAALVLVAVAAVAGRALRDGARGRTAAVSPARLAAALVGGAAVLLAVFPYVIVGQAPRFLGLWETRHQVTLMLVVGFALVATLRLVLWGRALRFAALGLLGLFLVLDVSTGRQLLTDRRAAAELVSGIAAEPVPDGTLVLLVEEDRALRALGRHFAFYEITHMVNRALGAPTRLVVSNREVLDPETGTYPTTLTPAVLDRLLAMCALREHPAFGFVDFRFTGDVLVIRSVATRPPPLLVQMVLGEEFEPLVALSRKMATVEAGECR